VVSGVVAVLERGYHSSKYPLPLSPAHWAKLTCTLMSAVGRGLISSHPVDEAMATEIGAVLIDPAPLGPDSPTFLHRLAATASSMETDAATACTEREEYADYYFSIKRELHDKATKAAGAEIEESWRQMRAEQISKRASKLEAEISLEVCNRNTNYFLNAAADLGLHLTGDAQRPPGGVNATPSKKRMVSGSEPAPAPSTPVILRRNPPRSVNSSPSPTGGQRGRTGPSEPQPRGQTDPSPTPRPRKAPAQVGQGSPMMVDSAQPGLIDYAALTAAIQAAVTPAVQAAVAPLAGRMDALAPRLEALERRSMPPPPVTRTTQHQGPNANSAVARQAPQGPITDTQLQHNPEGDGFTLVTQKKNRKGKERAGAGGQEGPPPTAAFTNFTPASYTGTAAAAAGIQQPKTGIQLKPVTVTEVTVIRSGGHANIQTENLIRSRLADAIIP
jgi:hypothetical protein